MALRTLPIPELSQAHNSGCYVPFHTLSPQLHDNRASSPPAFPSSLYMFDFHIPSTVPSAERWEGDIEVMVAGINRHTLGNQAVSIKIFSNELRMWQKPPPQMTGRAPYAWGLLLHTAGPSGSPAGVVAAAALSPGDRWSFFAFASQAQLSTWFRQALGKCYRMK